MEQSEKSSWKRHLGSGLDGKGQFKNVQDKAIRGWFGANFLDEGKMWAKAGSINVWGA